MAYHIEKETGDIVIDGFQKGIAPSPHLGIANMQCANIYTESGEVMVNFARAQDSQTPISGGTLTYYSNSELTYSGTTPLKIGWINITNAGTTGITTGYYWIAPSAITTGKWQLYTFYLSNSTESGFSSGSATFSTLTMAAPIQNQAATEKYFDSSGNTQYRYYIATTNGQLWCKDTGQTSGVFATLEWSAVGSSTNITTSLGTCSGLSVIDGVVLIFTNGSSASRVGSIYYKQTSRLDADWSSSTSGLKSPLTPHYAITNHNGYVFYTDGDFIGQILPSSVSSAGNVNVWSYGITVLSGTNTFNVGNATGGYLIGGNFPVTGATITFYSGNGGTLTNISAGTIYYVIGANLTNGTFQISATVGGAAITSISTTGGVYFNTFWPNPSTSGNSTSISYEALQLSSNETSQCLVELGSNLLIGCNSNNVYNWNEQAISAGGTVTVVQFPEQNTVAFVQANNVAYSFTGNKGNIYVTNGSFVSIAVTVPDYTAGVAGTPTSYVEPYFIWGGTAFMRGRIWFSVQDQTASKTGNDGGIWSFVPSFFDPITGQDAGLGLRLEVQNSYGTYNGMALVIVPYVSQVGIGPQYYSAWQSDQNSGSATYGIDTISPNPYTGGESIIETDFIPYGQLLGSKKGTPSNLEFRLSSPLVSGESVAIYWRQDLTSEWVNVLSTGESVQYDGTLVGNAEYGLNGYFSPHTISNVLNLQFQIVLISTATNPSFVRFMELRVRKQ